MMSFSLRLVVASLAFGAVIACRGPQDPSHPDGALLRDGGSDPRSPEVEPNTGPAIGPIASSSTGGTPMQQAPGFGGSGGIGGVGGVGGVAGANRVALH